MNFRISDQTRAKWAPLIEHSLYAPITDKYRRDVTIQILENQAKQIRADKSELLSEAAPITNMGGGNIAAWDPILISMVRRAMPNLIAYDVCGVQPMTGPTGLIFAMRSRYGTQTGQEAFFPNEPDTSFSGKQPGMPGYKGPSTPGSTGDQGTDPFNGISEPGNTNPFSSSYLVGDGMTLAQAEALGDGVGYAFNQMTLTIEKVPVTANTRALKADYSTELAQDLKAIHGLDAETELANILSTEILAEINREVIRSLYYIAKPGAQKSVTTAGVFDLNVDSNGRWLEEKFKGMLFQIDRDANQIARETRRGKGNFIVCSSDVASALSMTGVLSYAPALATNLNVDDTGNTFAGVLRNNTKVFIDPYFNNTGDLNSELLMVGYKGVTPYDAGFFYCPYIPLQMMRAVGENNFQPRIGFKTRYGLVANPYYTNAAGTITGQSNPYYRIIRVMNLS